MKISYNWLKWYIPDAPSAEKLVDVFTFHLCEVDSLEKSLDGDFIFDLKILPNRAHDLLSHHGVARELASLLNIKFIDPTLKYKIPESKPTKLKIEVESDKCRRYMGRIIRNIKVGPSPKWVVKHLESIGQKSINNMVDAANLTMFDCGQPTHVFDLNKIKDKLVVRQARNGEMMTTLDNKECKFKSEDLVIADVSNVLAVAGVKGGKLAEVDMNTTDVVLECANFDPTSVRKTAQMLNITTDAKKRFENDLSPELAPFAMTELSALIAEMCPEAIFEDIIDTYPQKQTIRKLSFFADRVSKILGLEVSVGEIEDILKRYNFEYTEKGGEFEMTVSLMRLDLTIEEDMAEEIGRVLGYDKLKPTVPKINFKPKENEIYKKITSARNNLLNDGYNEVMNSSFRMKGEVEVLASASDKNFLRTNLSDGLKESLKLNQANAPLLGLSEIKIFEIGTIFKKGGEEMHVCYGDKKEIIEKSLEDFCKDMYLSNSPLGEYPLGGGGQVIHPGASATPQERNKFKMWSLFPFIARDIAVWVPSHVISDQVLKVIKENAGNMVVRGPELFDEFKKGNQTSYAFRLVFQSYEKTLTDSEVNDIMIKIANKIKDQNGWQVR